MKSFCGLYANCRFHETGCFNSSLNSTHYTSIKGSRWRRRGEYKDCSNEQQFSLYLAVGMVQRHRPHRQQIPHSRLLKVPFIWFCRILWVDSILFSFKVFSGIYFIGKKKKEKRKKIRCRFWSNCLNWFAEMKPTWAWVPSTCATRRMTRKWFWKIRISRSWERPSSNMVTVPLSYSTWNPACGSPTRWVSAGTPPAALSLLARDLWILHRCRGTGTELLNCWLTDVRDEEEGRG